MKAQKNKIEYGLTNVFYSIIQYDELNNKSTYGKPKRLNGAISLTMDVEGEATTVYADNTVYYNATSNQGYSGSLNIATPTKEFLKEVFALGDFNGAMYEDANAKIKEIALGFEFVGDAENTRVWMYRVSLNRGGQEHNTKTESVEADTYTYNFKAMPRLEDAKVRIWVTAENELYANWFEAVVDAQESLPNFEITNSNIENNGKYPQSIKPEFNFSNEVESKTSAELKQAVLLTDDQGLKDCTIELTEDKKITVQYNFELGKRYSIIFTKLLTDVYKQQLANKSYNFEIVANTPVENMQARKVVSK